MTTNELISTYGIEFLNKVIKFDNGVSKVNKFPQTASDELLEFLFRWGNPANINDSLIPDIESVLNEKVPFEDTDGGNVFVTITPTQTFVYTNQPEDAELVLPTQDFYDIVILWRDFLLTPPLHGTHVRDNGNFV